MKIPSNLKSICTILIQDHEILACMLHKKSGKPGDVVDEHLKLISENEEGQTYICDVKPGVAGSGLSVVIIPNPTGKYFNKESKMSMTAFKGSEYMLLNHGTSLWPRPWSVCRGQGKKDVYQFMANIQ